MAAGDDVSDLRRVGSPQQLPVADSVLEVKEAVAVPDESNRPEDVLDDTAAPSINSAPRAKVATDTEVPPEEPVSEINKEADPDPSTAAIDEEGNMAPPSPGLGERSEVFVVGLSRDIAEDEVKRVFGRLGQILEVRMKKEEDPATNESKRNKGFCFVRFATETAATKAAAEMNGVRVAGRPVAVLSGYLRLDTTMREGITSDDNKPSMRSMLAALMLQARREERGLPAECEGQAGTTGEGGEGKEPNGIPGGDGVSSVSRSDDIARADVMNDGVAGADLTAAGAAAVDISNGTAAADISNAAAAADISNGASGSEEGREREDKGDSGRDAIDQKPDDISDGAVTTGLGSSSSSDASGAKDHDGNDGPSVQDAAAEKEPVIENPVAGEGDVSKERTGTSAGRVGAEDVMAAIESILAEAGSSDDPIGYLRARSPEELAGDAKCGGSASKMGVDKYECGMCGFGTEDEEAHHRHLGSKVHRMVATLRQDERLVNKTPLALLNEFAMRNRIKVGGWILCHILCVWGRRFHENH